MKMEMIVNVVRAFGKVVNDYPFMGTLLNKGYITNQSLIDLLKN